MSVTEKDPRGPEELNVLSLNYSTADPTLWDDATEIGNATAWVERDIDMPDDHVVAVTGVKTDIGDPQEIAADFPVEVWYFEGDDYVPQNSWVSDNDQAYAHTSFAKVTEGITVIPADQEYNFLKGHGFPILNADGTFRFRVQYGGGDHAELGMNVYYEFVEVDQSFLINELTGRH